jgi:oxygen-independent coproporphyrinogen-3 oxidase
VDLIFGIPEQVLDTWRRNLEMVVALGVEHLSCYGLTYEAGTRLRAQLEVGRVQRLDEDLEADMYELMLDLLGTGGFEHYEISNFARPGRACRHNVRYWRNEPYLGLGPSAAGYVGGVRYKNVPDTAAYVAAIQMGADTSVEREELSRSGQARETAMLNLRLTRGIDRGEFGARFGEDPATLFAEVIAPHVADGLLESDNVGIRLTRRGLLLANVVMRDFV